MTETTGMELVLPHSGEIIDPADLERLANAYEEIQRLEGDLNRAKRAIAARLRDHTATIGDLSFQAGARRVQIQGGHRTIYEGQQLADDLRAAGMPEGNVDEIVTMEVTYKVDAVRAKRAARVNPAYAAAVERNSQTVESTPRVVVS